MSIDRDENPPCRPKGAARTRWPKGQSGNRKGRPRKAPAEPAELNLSMVELIVAEAARPVTLTEGGKPVTMPAGLAVLRATLLSALKGNANAQRTYTSLVTASQAQQEKLKQGNLKTALALKIDLEHQRDLWLLKGHVEADMATHPDDIEVNYQTGEVKNYLCLTDEQFEGRRRAIALRDYAIGVMPELLEAAKDGDDLFLELGRERASRIIDKVNELLPQWRRRSLPGEDDPVLLPNQTPEEIWLALWRQAGSFLMNDGERGAGGGAAR